MDRRGFFTFSAGAAVLLLPGRAFAQAKNQFSGNPRTEWLPDGINMELFENFSYTDPQGRNWKAPAPYKTNGASIPRWLWALAGSPFVGKYRDAAIIHDYYCDSMTRSWQATHRVFYDAMLARGVGIIEAKSKYAAVHEGGPRWNDTHVWYTRIGLYRRPRSGLFKDFSVQSSKGAIAEGIVEQKFEQAQKRDFAQVEAFIKAENPTLDEIDQREPTYDFNYEVELREAQRIVDEFTVENKNGQLLAPRELLNPQELEFGTDLKGLETILQRPPLDAQF